MTKALKFAAAMAVALPLIGLGAAGSAEARDRYDNRYENSDRYDRGNDRYDEDRRDNGRQQAWSQRRIRQHMERYFYNIGSAERQGDVYFVAAETRIGGPLRVRVNAYTGHVEHVDHLRGVGYHSGREYPAKPDLSHSPSRPYYR